MNDNKPKLPKCLHCAITELVIDHLKEHRGIDAGVPSPTKPGERNLVLDKVPANLHGGIAMALAKATGEFVGSIPQEWLAQLIHDTGIEIATTTRETATEPVYNAAVIALVGIGLVAAPPVDDESSTKH